MRVNNAAFKAKAVVEAVWDAISSGTKKTTCVGIQ